MDFEEIRLGNVDCIRPAEDKDTWSVLINTVMKRSAPYHAGNLTISDSTNVSSILFHALCELAVGHRLRYDTKRQCVNTVSTKTQRNGVVGWLGRQVQKVFFFFLENPLRVRSGMYSSRAEK